MANDNLAAGNSGRDNKDNFDQKLVDKIKQEKLTPRPRWRFLLKDYVVWIFGILSLIIGALAVAVMMSLLKYSNWDIRTETHKTVWQFFLLTLPYFWIIFLGLFVFILYYNLKHTKRGYRYPIGLSAAAAVVASIALGSLFFVAGLGEKIDNILGENVPLYDTVINRNLSFWFDPDEGRLTGLVLSKQDARNFQIVDPHGGYWRIIVSADRPAPFLLRVGQPVDMIGRELDDASFQADLVRTIRIGRGFLLRLHHLEETPLPPLPVGPGQ